MKVAISLLLWCASATAAPLPLAAQIIACESSGQHLKQGRLNCNETEPNGKRSCGIAQFQLATFRDFRQRAHMERLQWTSEHDQLVLLKWSLIHHLAGHWSCYRKIEQGKWKMTADLDRAIRNNPTVMSMR